MPFQKILESMLSSVGVEAVALLDSEGETILAYGGDHPEKLKLVGAYQGILLTAVGKMGIDGSHTIVTLYDNCSVLTRGLAGGYFVSVIFHDVNYARIQFHFQELYRSLEKEL